MVKTTRSSKHRGGGLDMTTVLIVGVMSLVLLAVYYKMYMRNVSEGFASDSIDVKPNETALVLFYADWCPHCKSFKPDWEKASNKLDGTKTSSGKTLKFVDVDCTESGSNKALMQKYEVEGFPTVKVVNGNTVNDYDGPRSFDGIKKFAAGL